MSVLSVSNISKAYKRYSGKWARVNEWFTGKRNHEQTWVLRDINFELNPGEAVGIVGVNGAGKSTLLKIISGTTQATGGSIVLHGQVAALLELGMGFHPDFSGRQNALMGGQLLGMKAHVVQSRMPEIEAFAEIGDYFDRPVRTYSSGMQMRLAFSVATAIRPEVLIVDEALSVGDTYFQHKCMLRIRQFRKEGTSLLIVSHDRGAIQALCDRALLLENGFVIKDGAPEEVMDFYNAIIAEKENTTVEIRRLKDGHAQTISGTGEARVESIELINKTGEKIDHLSVGEPVQLRIQVGIHDDLSELVCGYMIRDRLGQPIFGTNTFYLNQPLKNLQKGAKILLEFSFNANLGIGSYSITTALHVGDNHLIKNYEWKDFSLVFNIVNISHSQFEGIGWIPPQLKISS